MVNVADRTDVDVRLSTFELLFSHYAVLLKKTFQIFLRLLMPTHVDTVEPLIGIEPMTSSLPRMRSTPEL